MLFRFITTLQCCLTICDRSLADFTSVRYLNPQIILPFSVSEGIL